MTSTITRKLGFDNDLICSDYCEERGLTAEAWVLRHSGKLTRKQTKAICEAVGFPGRKIYLRAVPAGEMVELHGNYWDEGNRSYFWRIDNLTGHKFIYKFPDTHPMYNRAVTFPTMGEESFLVEHAIYGRGTDTLTIYGTPTTLMRLFS